MRGSWALCVAFALVACGGGESPTLGASELGTDNPQAPDSAVPGDDAATTDAADHPLEGNTDSPDGGCEPDALDCDGANVAMCVAGVWQKVAPACPKGCTKGHCNACAAGPGECIDGATLSACVDGLSVTTTCPLGCDVLAGACTSCPVGTTRCAFSGVEVCAADGIHYLALFPCPLGCDAATATCITCAPGATWCNDQGLLSTCGAAGTDVVESACDLGCDPQAGICKTPAAGKCIQASPSVLDFKSVIAPGFAKQTVNMFGCGDADVTITAVAVVAGAPDPSDFDFELAAGQVLPMTLHPGAKVAITIRFKPDATHKDATGHFLPDTATLVVTNDSPVAALQVPLTGLPIEGQCAVADFKATLMGQLLTDGQEIAVQSDIKFIDTSFDATPGGAVVAWAWAVVAPPGSADVFTPGPNTANAYFTANVVGDYAFTLTVANKFGCENTRTMHLKVPPPKGCHVQLTWTTPLDLDPTDHCASNADCGSDLDLHVVHPAAMTPGVDLDGDGQPDGFFDIGQSGGLAGDCFWFNAHPCWVQDQCSDPAHQPSLDLDDTDGAGPENFTYVLPQAGKCYKIGVHYWDDHGFGASYPTVRVWVDATKLYETAVPPKLKKLDLWEVGEVCCSAGTFNEFKTSDGNPVVVPNYVNPDFNFNN